MNLATLTSDFSHRFNTLTRAVQQTFSFIQRRQPLSDRPIRGVILTTGQLEERARALAAGHTVVMQAGKARALLASVDRNHRLLRLTYQTLAADAAQRQPLTPAAAWLVDNYHVIVSQIREIRQDLPGGYYHELPKLKGGPHDGKPRVYALALELIEHTDGRIDLEQLTRFVLAYEAVAPLSIGEIWAIPIMLRVGLIQNLGRLARLMIDERRLRLEGATWAERILAQKHVGSFEGNTAFRQLARMYPQLPLPLAVELIQRLRDQEGEFDIAQLMVWLEQQPSIPYNTAEEIILAEQRRQSANQVSVANTITSMRTMDAVDWPDWFERVSLVEQVLRQDPAGAYGQSTFATRDRYRHELERLSRRSGLSEDAIARRLIHVAARAREEGRPLRETHIGYYLVDEGRFAFEASLGCRLTPGEVVRRAVLRHPEAVYLGAITAGTVAITAAGMRLARSTGRSEPSAVSPILTAALSLTAVIPAFALAKELVDRAVTRLVPPRVLPRLDFRHGIPRELRTMVVVPTLLLTPDSIRTQIESLEVLALANQDLHLHFALLTDFADAPRQHMPEDEHLLALAVSGIERLNERYGSNRFFLLHRHRVWNERQGCWMGWERKRGKLEEFNRLLAGARDTTYEMFIGDLSILPQIRYVITLDADTQLPRDTARALIGTLAHPLNQAVIDPQTQRVVQGYGILQPRVGIDLPSALRSRFARISSGNVGVDPYTTAVSDVYMDLFGEGIFAGKGIYDPVAMRTALHDRFPENTLLSHDLIEGCYARAALLSDVELLDSYPTTYAAYSARQHRWVRGDWQIAGWLLPRVPRASGGSAPNVLTLISRFKIADNLRRSLTPPATLALLVAGWFVLPGRPAVWTLLALGHYLAPLTFAVINLRLMPANWRYLRTHLIMTIGSLRWPALQLLLNVAMLPDQAWLNMDAIVRTLWRMGVTHRRMLEWETAAQAQRRLTNSFDYLIRRMAPSAVVALALAVVRIDRLRTSWLPALPVVASWVAAPFFARWLDQEYIPRNVAPLSANDRRMLRRVARATWAYFDRFIVPDQNFLAPDNFQETPRPVVAERTSPTNIGLQLLADLAAVDFGYLGARSLVERVERVFDTIQRMERFRGHLYNWYDTRTLHPLPPLYVSTVDSGNFAAHLLTLRQGLRALIERPTYGPWIIEGLRDILEIIQERLPTDARGRTSLIALLQALDATPDTLEGYRARLLQAADLAIILARESRVAEWAEALTRQAYSLLNDMPHDDVPSAAEDPQFRAAVERLADVCTVLITEIDFRFLYDERRRLFAIGYNVSEGRRDNSYYDLLASEARLASFIAIALGEVPQEHWFYIGRKISPAVATPTLLAWSGTMFEYLMPLLVMRNFPETLLDSTYRGAVERQIAYATGRGIPWGISESAFNLRDSQMNYQYRAFGVPGLGLQSGLANDLVVAPYATLLALQVAPNEAIANLRTLMEYGAFGTYGFYEAIDFTPERLPPGVRHAIVQTYMVHHQGMGLLALDNLLHDNIMQRRFHAEPIVQATELLLQEKIPADRPLPLPQESAVSEIITTPDITLERHFTTPHTAAPYAYILSNGVLTTIVTNAGGGGSRFTLPERTTTVALTRWRPDPTRDASGSFVYVRDIRSGVTWSPTYQPLRTLGDDYRVTCGAGRVKFRQHYAGIDTRLEITVSPEDHVEVRVLTLVNLTSQPRELEVTTYAEIVLAPDAADAAHPVFSNLFIETSFDPMSEALLATRRPRAPSDERLWVAQTIGVRGRTLGELEYETDRMTFIGRGHDPSRPQALDRPLNGRVGSVLDPIFSQRRRVRIVPGGQAQVIITLSVAATREDAIRLADHYRDAVIAMRAFDMARIQAQVELTHLGINADQAHQFQRLASLTLLPDPVRRAASDALLRNTKGQPGLWAYGVSGDYPIVVGRIAPTSDTSLARSLIQAHEYWRLKGVLIDLVLLVEDGADYRQERYEQIMALMRSSRSSRWLNQRGGVFVLRTGIMPEADQTLFEAVSRITLHSRRGDLSYHLRRRLPDKAPPPPSITMLPFDDAPLPAEDLILTTEYGGFTVDGREFVIEVVPGNPTPLPWVNVVANPRAGFIVSESGCGYTWAENSRENRLTPWSNDPVSDPPGEAIYLRDEAGGALWSPLPRPCASGRVRVYHGMGYSRFLQQSNGIESETTLSIAPDDPVKIIRLRLRNRSAYERRLSVTMYVDWASGVLREQTALFIVTSTAPERSALLARNVYSHDFAGRVAFLACSESEVAFCGDRTAFIGRNSDLARPIALVGAHDGAFDNRIGAGLDPCGVVMATFTLNSGETRDLFFLLGQGADEAEALTLIDRYRNPAAATGAIEETIARWRNLVSLLRVRTPDPALDVLLNGWLLYQTLSCRIWGRSAFYQSGGAYGFRDQLQDVMALTMIEPSIARDHILRAAARQFVEGDVQHWWHPPLGRGIRTAFSDDYLWLPFVVCHYVETTGDWALLDVVAPYIKGRPLAEDEAEYYDLPEQANESGSIYDHCIRAIDRALRRMGAHGLPLMGSGDWNDGMNLVGHGGRGESVWVAWFLIVILNRFAPIAEQRRDIERAARYRAEARRLSEAIDRHAWDGDWYLRAFYDDGTPLGSARDDECRIDSLSQSWAVIAGTADPTRARQAMEAVDRYLVDRETGIVKLFTPPFDQTPRNPGYIKGYVPGVRENGGQYTHAAIWVAWAWTILGEHARAGEMLRMLNPVHHAQSCGRVYAVEPYVIAADIYSAPQHLGRGGWTWYTGSAAWFYRLGIERILGIQRHGDHLTLTPCLPPDWPGYEAWYRCGSSEYHIIVERGSNGYALTIDGVPADELIIPLRDDGLRHEVHLFLPAAEVSVSGKDGSGTVQERSAASQ
jgi:cyclic beta-1,2-glucan synthetase